ncbi:hypothetical protein ABTL26_19500, partial [Acinetobacter baumannii]
NRALLCIRLGMRAMQHDFPDSPLFLSNGCGAACGQAVFALQNRFAYREVQHSRHSLVETCGL